jgi:hypothetical protein
MAFLRKLVSEPLFQFMVIGALLFAGYSLLQRDTGDQQPETIVVSAGWVGQLAEIFSRTWQRPPTADELSGLVDAFVKEEIFYREGRKLGLDEDDTVFRRRLQQKMEFLMEPSPADLTPNEGELEAFFAANRETYRIPMQVAFEQVFINAERAGARAGTEVRAVVTALREETARPEELGDRTLLPSAMPPSSITRVDSIFGEEFAEAVAGLAVGEWTGPVMSTFGLHVVRVGMREGPRDPDLSEVANIVRRDWEEERRRAIADERYAELRKRYTVVIEQRPPEQAASAATEQAAR